MDWNQLSDEELMVCVLARQEKALDILYNRYAPMVMGVALKIVKDPLTAEEVVQESFWRVWERAESFRQRRGSFAAWLFGLSRNLAIDQWRRIRVRPQAARSTAEQEKLERQMDSNPSVPEVAWATIQQNQVRAAMLSLPNDQRQVIEMAYFNGLTRQEIAAETNIPLGTIHTRARLALQKLRQLLQSEGGED